MGKPLGELDILGNIGFGWFWEFFFVGGCYVDHKLVVSNELKGLGKDGHIALLSH